MSLVYNSGELARWQWNWIKQDRIIIPREFQKNSRALRLPITSKAEKLLSQLRSETGDTDWLFPNPACDNSRLSFRKYKLRMEDKMTPIEPWTLRDVRRTVETQLRELRIPSDVVAVILNHNTSHLRKIYDKSENLSEKKAALVKYEKYLDKLKVKGAESKVVNLAEYRA